ncbi:SDR family oxidoreductase [Fimbriimonas ginsengisoli]|nr:SDR family NAD(P)-dependent oxidoreductase [Fimbriimonas ginsengisoli]
MGFENRVVVVTGAAGGVGRQVAKRWLDAGAKVVAVDRSASHLDVLGSHERLATSGADLLTASGAEEMIRFARSAFGAPDTLIHTVGGFRMGPVDAPETAADWDLMMALNAASNFHCYRAMLPSLRERNGGWLVGIASRTAVQPAAQMAAYSASKAALIALTQSMAAELRGEDIHVNVLLASTIDTPANREAMGEEAAKKWVTGDDIADATFYLCSDQAKSIHGATLEIYGKA